MARKPKELASEQARVENAESLRKLLEGRVSYRMFMVWIVGDTPLITHSWSEKAKREILRKQVKAVKQAGREARDPQEDFTNSLYEIGDDVYGFPTTAVKLALCSAAHKDKGIAKTNVLGNLWLDHTLCKVRPALAGAICDMPLTRVWGAAPQMREDMVRIGGGMRRTATLAYRGQFFPWAMRVSGRFNPTQLPSESLAFLIDEGGRAAGIGEWRNEKNGMFGLFHFGDPTEEAAWEAFAKGEGSLPIPPGMQEAAE